MPDENVPWSVSWASYAPIAYTAPAVIENNRVTKPGGWADPEISGLGPEDWKTRVSYEGEFRFDEQNGRSTLGAAQAWPIEAARQVGVQPCRRSRGDTVAPH